MPLALGILCAGIAGALFGDSVWQVLLGQGVWIGAYWFGCRAVDRCLRDRA
jgi:hypothetical protein